MARLGGSTVGGGWNPATRSYARPSGSTSGGGGGTSGTIGGGGGGTISGPSPSNVYKGLAEDYEESRTEQQQRYQQGLSELAEVAGLFGPGYGAGMEQTALAGAKQSLIGRGLGGTTRPMAVSAGMKVQFEDLRRGKLAGALTNMAEYRKTSPQIYPAAGVLANLSLGARSSALQESAMNQPMGISGGADISNYMQMFNQSRGLDNSNTGVGGVDFSLPSIW